jgi:cell envelope opacity-associated protein A
MAKFKKGDEVKVSRVVPQGTVEAFQLDENGDMQYMFSWTDDDGATQQRWFNESDLVAA